MAYLPDELWLAILSHCELRTAWLGLRPVNRQSRDCAEQYFYERILPRTTLHLRIAIPSYDVRRTEYEQAHFVPVQPPAQQPANGTGKAAPTCSGRAHFKLVKTPGSQGYIMDKWEKLRQASAHALLPGTLDHRLVWHVSEGSGTSVKMRLPHARVEGLDADDSEIHRDLSCDWQVLFAGFFRGIDF